MILDKCQLRRLGEPAIYWQLRRSRLCSCYTSSAGTRPLAPSSSSLGIPVLWIVASTFSQRSRQGCYTRPLAPSSSLEIPESEIFLLITQHLVNKKTSFPMAWHYWTTVCWTEYFLVIFVKKIIVQIKEMMVEYDTKSWIKVKGRLQKPQSKKSIKRIPPFLLTFCLPNLVNDACFLEFGINLIW